MKATCLLLEPENPLTFIDSLDLILYYSRDPVPSFKILDHKLAISKRSTNKFDKQLVVKISEYISPYLLYQLSQSEKSIYSGKTRYYVDKSFYDPNFRNFDLLWEKKEK